MLAPDGRLAAVELVDAHLCSDAGKFLAALLLSLSSMLHLELPHINILSKADLVEAYGELHFNLEYYTEVCTFAGGMSDDVQRVAFLRDYGFKESHLESWLACGAGAGPVTAGGHDGQ